VIKSTKGARNDVIDLDILSDEAIKAFGAGNKRLCEGNIDERRGDVKARQTAVMRRSRQVTRRRRNSILLPLNSFAF